MAELTDEPRGAAAKIEARSDPAGVPVVVVSGELDVSNTAALEATVAPIVAKRPPRVIFDLSALRFMDSAGIAVLVDVSSKVGAVHLRDPSPPVRRVVELTGLADVLTVEP